VTINDVGDIATLTLTVAPSGVDTSATVTVTSPTGVVTSPTTTPNGDRSIWTAQLPLTLPGEYLIRWVVTGTGAGAEQSAVTARPALPVVVAGPHVYATTADLANFLEKAPPANARRLLWQASRDVERATKTAIYDVDDNGFPTDTAVKAAMRDAVCAQVEWWGETGDSLGAGGQWSSVKIGSVALDGRAAASGTGGELTPNAVTFLENAGLLPGSVLHFDGRQV
jgi:hypothetical protein